jgi:hypothetical protein
VACLPRATRQAVAGRVLSQESSAMCFSVVDQWGIKLRTQASPSDECPVYGMTVSKARLPMTAVLQDRPWA